MLGDMMDTKVLRNLSYGVYIVSTMDQEKPVGCVANSVMQITSDPITVAVSINHDNYTNQIIKDFKKFAINILPETVDMNWIGTFGFESSKNINKFEQIDYRMEQSLPILPSTCGALLCEVKETIETSTHTIFIGTVYETVSATKDNPMTYAYYHQVKKGTSPKTAPTYIANETEQKEDTKEKKKTKWVCTVCGYVVEMDELPDDFRCPICGREKEAFKKLED